MKITDVYKIASLAKLELGADEARRMEKEMRQFAEYARSLDDFSGDCFPTSCVEERTRADEVGDAKLDLSAFANGVTQDGYISVPLTVEAE